MDFFHVSSIRCNSCSPFRLSFPSFSCLCFLIGVFRANSFEGRISCYDGAGRRDQSGTWRQGLAVLEICLEACWAIPMRDVQCQLPCQEGSQFEEDGVLCSCEQ